jgi:diguanylate cyclase (GGDEF)-like protein
MITNIFLPHILLWIFTFITTLLTIYLLWPRRNMVSGWLVMGYALGLAEWTFAGTLEALVIDPQTKILFAKIEYIGFLAVVPFAYLFVKQYVTAGRISFSQAMPVFILPVITLAVVWTNDSHHLFWSSFVPGNQSLNLLIYNHGPWFYVNSGYIYLLVLLSIVRLVRAYRSGQKLFRNQLAAILGAFIFPLISCTTYILGIVPVEGMDTTALGFGVAGLIIAFALLRLQLVELLPIACEQIFESMRDGVMVLDGKNRLVDINPAAQKFMLIDPHAAIGSPVTKLLPKVLLGLFEPNGHNIASLEILARDQKTYINVYTTPLGAKGSESSGTLITFQDITPRKQVELRLQQSNIQLQKELQQIEELQESLRAQAVRDPLTGLYNRRYLEETLEREISRAWRTQTSVAVMMIDFDGFKEVNDHFSHQAGDKALQTFGEILKKTSRREDIACRYGGDEFLMILPEIEASAAQQRGESWRKSVADLQLTTPQGKVKLTVSIGIAMFPQHGSTADELIHAADKAMYDAKRQGKNFVRLALSDHHPVELPLKNSDELQPPDRQP